MAETPETEEISTTAIKTGDIRNIMDKQEQQSSRDFSNRWAPAKAVMPGASQTRKMGRDPSNSRGLANINSISFQEKQTYQEHYGLATAAGMPAKAGDLAKKGMRATVYIPGTYWINNSKKDTASSWEVATAGMPQQQIYQEHNGTISKDAGNSRGTT